MLLAAALAVTPAAVALNPAQQATLAVAGASGPVTATLDRNLVSVTTLPDGRHLVVTATQATGSDVLHVADAAGDTANVPVRVAFNAGTIVPQLAVTVTGNPVDPLWLQRTVRDAVGAATATLPGAQASMAVPVPAPPPPGESESVAVPVQIAGNGAYFDVNGVTNVTVTDRALPAAPAQLLFYDDDPESVDGYGTLYTGSVSAGTPVRLYTYHDDAGGPARIAVVLSAAVPSQVQAIDAPAGPNVDVMSVGHAVGVEYLSEAPIGEGVVLSLDAQAPDVLHEPILTNGELVAEALYLRVLSGGPVSVTVLSLAPQADPGTALHDALLAGDGHERTGVFSLLGYPTLQATYVAGGPNASVTYGDRATAPPNVRPQSPGRDDGDYGVVHRIILTLTNPGDAATNAYLYERPEAGPVRSTFLVDGSLVQLGCARLSVPYQIQAYALAPHATYQVSLETMTDGGSNYPLEVGITGTPPVPQTPAVDAPDGCFPR